MLCNIHIAITSLSLLWHPRHQHSILHPNPAQPRPATTRIKSVVYLLPGQSILLFNRLKLYTMRRKGNISNHAPAKIFVDVDIWYTRVGVGFMVLSLRRVFVKANDIYTEIVADSNLIFGGSLLRRYREYVCYDSHFCNAILATKMERVVDRYATCPHHS